MFYKTSLVLLVLFNITVPAIAQEGRFHTAERAHMISSCVHKLDSGIRDKWTRSNQRILDLGCPANQYNIPQGRRSDFGNAYVTWKRQTNRTSGYRTLEASASLTDGYDLLTPVRDRDAGGSGLEGGTGEGVSERPIEGDRPRAAIEMTTANTGKIPLTVEFDASGSRDSDGSINEYRWDFGDGRKESTLSPVVDHTYNKVWTYNVILRVVDNDGNISDPIESRPIVAMPRGLVFF